MIEKAHSKLIEHGTTLNREQRQELIDELLILFNVSQQRELLVWLQKSDLVTFTKDEINEVIDDYRFYQTNCG
jgi:arginine repressor